MKTSQALSVINRSSYIIRVQMLTLSLLFNMPKTIAIYGDSYVKRLREFCGGDLHVPGSIYWYDKSGLRADFKRRDGQPDTYAIARFNQMLDLRPDVAFINVCGNDITSKTEPSEIIDRVVKITSDLREAGTTTIFISEILTRGDFSKSQDTQLDKATFDRKRQKINSGLAKRFKDNLIRFPDIKYPKDYSTDLVHLLDYSPMTNNTGLKKYERWTFEHNFYVPSFYNYGILVHQFHTVECIQHTETPPWFQCR